MKFERIALRPIERADLPYLLDLANDPVVRAQVVGWDWPLSMASQERWFDGGIDTATTRRLLIIAPGGEPIGVTGLWDIDWRAGTAMSAIKIGGDQAQRGRGYGTQAIRQMMEFAFVDVGLRRLYAQILACNDASLALYRDKCGWVQEGVARQHVWKDGRYRDVVNLAMLREEYLAWKDGLGAAHEH